MLLQSLNDLATVDRFPPPRRRWGDRSSYEIDSNSFERLAFLFLASPPLLLMFFTFEGLKVPMIGLELDDGSSARLDVTG